MMTKNGDKCQRENGCGWECGVKFGEILRCKECDRYKNIKMNDVGSVHSHSSYILCKYKIKEYEKNDGCHDSFDKGADQKNGSDNQPADKTFSQFALQSRFQVL